MTETSLCSQLSEIQEAFFSLCETFKYCLAMGFLEIKIPKYLTVSFTGMFLIEISLQGEREN